MKYRSNSDLTYKYLLAACLASLIISTFASYFFYNKWSEAEDRYVSVMNEKNMLNQSYNQVKNSFEKSFSDLMVMRDENANVISLFPVDSTKRYLARVYWNRYTREVFIDVISLPPPDSSRQYQLWALLAGQPVSAGVFNSDTEEGTQRMRSVIDADSWVVTIEPKGGSAIPNREQLYLLSKN